MKRAPLPPRRPSSLMPATFVPPGAPTRVDMDDPFSHLIRLPSMMHPDARSPRIITPSPQMTLALGRMMMSAFVAGYARNHVPLDACADLVAFAHRYALRVPETGKRINVSNPADPYSHLLDLWADNHPSVVLQAGAQTGKSLWLIVRIIRAMIEHWGAFFGYFFPDYTLPQKFSRDRFAPFVKSAPELAAWFAREEQDDAPRIKSRRGSASATVATTDSVLSRSLGPSRLYFLSTAGRTATEGMPLKGVFFDEVRRMDTGDIQRAMERTSAQTGPLDFKVSTANLPNSDINAFYLASDQRKFHTMCRCADGVILSETFPACVVDLNTSTAQFRAKVEHRFRIAGMLPFGMTDDEIARYGLAAYVCPKCGEIITNPRDGWWEAHNPSAYAHGYQMPQLLGWPAARGLRKWQAQETRPVDVQELFNSMLGLPYLDPSARRLTDDDLLRAVNTRARWAVRFTEGEYDAAIPATAMGVDVQAGYLVVVIKALTPDRRHRTIHLEVAEPGPEDKGDPWRALARIFERFKVRCAIIDAMPEHSDAQRFALLFRGKVFLCYYNEGRETPMVRWKDATDGGQKGKDAKFKYNISVNRTKMFAWNVRRWSKGNNETPPGPLNAVLPVTGTAGGTMVVFRSNLRGERKVVDLVRGAYHPHLLGVIFQQQKDPETGVVTVRAEHMGGMDPHFAHADAWASVALDRLSGRLNDAAEDEP